MQLSCKLGIKEIAQTADLDSYINACASLGSDDLWLYGTAEYPCLALLINEQTACIHYFASSAQCYQSLNETGSYKTIEFYMENQELSLPGSAILPLSKAIECAKQFFLSQNKPSCIKWLKLYA